MNSKEILEELKSFYDPSSIEGMKRSGINPNKVFGVKIPILRKMVKKNQNKSRFSTRIMGTRL